MIITAQGFEKHIRQEKAGVIKSIRLGDTMSYLEAMNLAEIINNTGILTAEVIKEKAEYALFINYYLI